MKKKSKLINKLKTNLTKKLLLINYNKRLTDKRYKTSDCTTPNIPKIINKSSKKFANTDPHMKPRKSNACLAPTDTCKI